MFRLYLEILAFNVGISVCVMLAVAAMSGIALTAEIFIFTHCYPGLDDVTGLPIARAASAA